MAFPNESKALQEALEDKKHAIEAVKQARLVTGPDRINKLIEAKENILKAAIKIENELKRIENSTNPNDKKLKENLIAESQKLKQADEKTTELMMKVSPVAPTSPLPKATQKTVQTPASPIQNKIIEDNIKRQTNPTIKAALNHYFHDEKNQGSWSKTVAQFKFGANDLVRFAHALKQTWTQITKQQQLEKKFPQAPKDEPTVSRPKNRK